MRSRLGLMGYGIWWKFINLLKVRILEKSTCYWHFMMEAHQSEHFSKTRYGSGVSFREEL